MPNNLEQMPRNYLQEVKWTISTYLAAAPNLAHAFQKDGIQNAVGARLNKSWNGWKCCVDYKKTDKGKFLIIEDFGTTGLIGSNFSVSEIEQMSETEISSKQRLARFTSMHNSGGNELGAGTYGVGKIMYSAVSELSTYYFDSKTIEGNYIANENQKGSVHTKAYENNEAARFIYEKTGLIPKKEFGTRIIIVKPKQDVIDSIESGEMQSYICDTWWPILEQMKEDNGIYINGVQLVYTDNNQYDHQQVDDKPQLYQNDKNYRVKHFGFFIVANELDKPGFYYYRKGMKIGEIEIIDLPKSLINRYWGYIEVDDAWELELANIEDVIHYGVQKQKKRTGTYQNLKNYVQGKSKACLIEWGYVKTQNNEDRKLNEIMLNTAKELQELFSQEGFEDLGKGPKKSDFDVRWQNIVYPRTKTETVETDEVIQYGFRIKNEYAVDKKFKICLLIKSMATQAEYNIFREEIEIKSGQIYEKKEKQKISSIVAGEYAENHIILLVKPSNSGKEKRKELPFWYAINRPDNSRNNYVDITLHSCEMPHSVSRRVNFGDTINNIIYRVENKRNSRLKFKVNISIHNFDDPAHQKLLDVHSIEGVAEPFETVYLDKIGEIMFLEDVYTQWIIKGRLELRARAIAAEDSNELEKGDKIGSYNFKIYLNCDEKNGAEDAFEPKTIVALDDKHRSWFENLGNNRYIYINSGHTAYKRICDDEVRQKEYIREEMLKQYVMLYLSDARYEKFFGASDNIDNMTPMEITKKVMDRIETVYAASLI